MESEAVGRAATEAPARGDEVRVVRIDRCAMAVRRPEGAGGSLPPALFVHGLGGASDNFSTLMGRLTDVLLPEAVDLPGFGYSAPPDDGDYSESGHARAVVDYLQAAGRGPVHLVGNSMGGAIAVRVAAERPDLVRTLTLVSPALPELPPQRDTLPTVLLGAPGAPAAFERLVRNVSIEDRTWAMVALVYGDPYRMGEAELRAAVAEYRRRIALPYALDAMARSARGVVASYLPVHRDGLWRQARRVLAPTLLVYGARDRLVATRMAPRAARAFRDARLVTLPDAGHVAMMEYPDLVAREMRELVGLS